MCECEELRRRSRTRGSFRPVCEGGDGVDSDGGGNGGGDGNGDGDHDGVWLG